MNFAKLEKIDPTLVEDILSEIGEKNTTRVYITRAGKKMELLSDSLVDDALTQAHIPMVMEADRRRVSAGLKPIYTDETMRRYYDMEMIGFNKNQRVNTGIDYCYTQLGSLSASATAVAKYIAVSNCTSAPSATNTYGTTASSTQINWGTPNATDAAAGTGRGEITGSLGFTRAVATPAHSTGVPSYSETITFTALSPVQSLQACGIFAATTQNNGPLFCENTYTPTSFATSDQLTIAWTFNI